MATTTGLLSWEAFEQFADDGMHHELIEGEHQILPPSKSRHALIAANCWKLLLAIEQAAGVRVLAEAGYKLSNNPPSWIQPDVSVLERQRVKNIPDDGYFHGAPELAVEVVSPSETPRDLQRKVKLLLTSGGHTVWVIYPETREVFVHSSDGTVLTRGIDDTLTLPGLLPDWQLPVAKLFEE
jgi:Uma2 family endonuclease